VSAVIAAALEDGIGIIALANIDAQQPAMTNITVTAAKKAFGFGVATSANTPRPPRNAGYGTAVLCSVHTGSSRSSRQSVLNDFRSVDESLPPNSTDLFMS
jgi:hypothetical protein